MCLAFFLIRLSRLLLLSPLSTPHLFNFRMVTTRSMTRRQNYDACSRKKSSTSWLDLSHDVLLLIMMKLSIVDFVAFSGVCRMLRSFAHSNWNFFMASILPMPMSISTDGYKKECRLVNSDGRRFRTTIPHSGGRSCVGVTCGYLILFGKRTRDFWLVNPITRHELHFPRYPFYTCTDRSNVRGTLVFSSSLSGWVFVVTLRKSKTVTFSLSGEQASWTCLSSKYPIYDSHAFQGKIYALSKRGRIYEVSLNSKPTLTLVSREFKYTTDLFHPHFASSGKILYMVDLFIMGVYVTLQLDLDEMQWDSSCETKKEFAFFKSPDRGIATNVCMWTAPRTNYESFTCFHGREVTNNDRWYSAKMWYVPRDCLNVNLLSDAYGDGPK